MDSNSDGSGHCTEEVQPTEAQITEVETEQELNPNPLPKNDTTKAYLKRYSVQTRMLTDKRSKLVLDIQNIIKEAIKALHQKEDRLIKKVTDQTEQDKEKLESIMQTKQMDLQLYQQQSHSIQQAFELEDEAQLFKLYHSPGATAGPKLEPKASAKYIVRTEAKTEAKTTAETLAEATTEAKADTTTQATEDTTAEATADTTADATAKTMGECTIGTNEQSRTAGEANVIFNTDWTQRMESRDKVDMWFMYDLNLLYEQIEMIDVMNEKLDVTIQHIDNIYPTAEPVLDEVVYAVDALTSICDVTDCLVMKVKYTQVYLFCESLPNMRLYSFYNKEGHLYSSVLKLSGKPCNLTLISEDRVAFCLPHDSRIITVAVTPDLQLLSTIRTSKNYTSLSALNKSTLVAGSDDEHCVDLINMNGTVFKTFTTHPSTGETLFRFPHYIHVTRQGTILVSDSGFMSVICLTLSGDLVFTYSDIAPAGLTSTTKGDILVADHWADKVVLLSESGEFIREILSPDLMDGFQCPTGLCVDGDTLYVAINKKGLHNYKFYNCDDKEDTKPNFIFLEKSTVKAMVSYD